MVGRDGGDARRAVASTSVAKVLGALHSLRATHERMVGAELDHGSVSRRSSDASTTSDGVPDEEEARALRVESIPDQ